MKYGVHMNQEKKIKHLFIPFILGLLLISTSAFGQYSVGQSISQASRNHVVDFCANEGGTETIGELLTPAAGEPNRVLWLNFFASY